MYSECLSLSDTIQLQRSGENVLRSFSPETGREVVASILKPLQELVLGKTYTETPLSTPEQVQWTMQVLGYGLTLPLSEKPLLNGCMEVYRDWLTALYFQKHTVPDPILQCPNHYIGLIFDHLCALFVPRHNEPRLLEEHVELCNKVVETVQMLVGVKGLKMTRDTWESLFSFLLHVCNLLLAPPTHSPSLGTSLCDAIIHVLFTSWLRACQDSFPNPNYWKTLRDFCCKWRHHISLIQQWSQLMYSITFQVIHHLYGSKHLSVMTPLPQQDHDFYTLLKDIPRDSVVQCWFRMLHTLGNPTDLLYADIITNTPVFRQAVSTSDVTNQIQECIASLPNIFHCVMKGIAAQVCLFLAQELPTIDRHSSFVSYSSTRSSPSVRRKDNPRYQFYVPVPPSGTKQESFYVNITPDHHSPPLVGVEQPSKLEGIIGKPKGNTVLHIYGNWLFEATVWEGQDQEGFPSRRRQGSTTIISSAVDISRIKEGMSSLYSDQQRIKDYESGRAEAFGCLCSIFSRMPCGEEVLRVYLTRFYHSLAIGLEYDDAQTCTGQVLTRIILTSTTLLRKDLPGINILVPHFLTAIEKILPENVLPYKGEASPEMLRRSSIQLLQSIIPLPHHFIHLKLTDLSSMIHSTVPVSNSSDKTFFSLKNRILYILFAAIKTEMNAINMNMLLHVLTAYIYDIISYEESLSKMINEEDTRFMDNHGGRVIIGETYKEDISLSLLFQQVIVSANIALTSWSSNNTVTLAALELLSGLATLHFDSQSHVDCRDAVQWVCDFIETQAHQKPHLQTKNLHTSIVAAFRTLLIWIMEHTHLLAHENCLASILRVIEFGITGSFSKLEDGKVVYKEDKELHPISGRVKDIAEFTLYCLMERFGSFPSACGAATTGSLLTEEELIKRLPSSQKISHPKFKYFLVDNAMILGILEKSFSDEEDSLPTVTVIIRGPAGRQVWSLQMRQNPRSENPSKSHLHSQPRPPPATVPPSCPDLKREPWPPEVMNAKLKLDESIPQLDQLLDDSSIPLHEEICQLLQKQIEIDTETQDHRPIPRPIALEPPEIKQNFDTARLILSHLGLLNIEALQLQSGSTHSSLVMLDSSTVNFRSSLAALDRMPTRYCDSVFVLYCRKGQNKIEEILANQQNLQTKPQEFLEFLQGLGWVVDPVKHPGFSGRLRPDSEEGSHKIGLNAQIPYRPFPYYADAISEVAFIQPVHRPSTSNSTSSVRSVESSDSGPESAPLGDTILPHTTSTVYLAPQTIPTWSAPLGSGVQQSSVHAVLSEEERPAKIGLPTIEYSDTPKRRTAMSQECAAMVVWLECFEDHLKFPVESLSKILYKGYAKASKNVLPIIFVHRLSSGLYQIVNKSTSSSPCGPLINGMVVSKRCLSTLVRHTVMNLCFSYRLENEGYFPPHMKRKRKIEELSSQFSKHMSVPEFYSKLVLNMDK